MKVTIIIPAYNSEKYIGKAILSCLNQTYTNLEILIVNDGSTDSTSHIISEYENKDARIKHIYQKNQGLVRARKTGVQNTKTTFFVFLDSDDTLTPNAIEELVKVNKEQNRDIIFSNFYTEFENGVLLHKSNNDYCDDDEYKDYAEKILSKKIAPTIWGKLIRTKLFLQIDTPDEVTIGEDAISILQLLSLKPKVGHVNTYIYHYIQHSDSMVNIVDLKKNKQRILFINIFCNTVPNILDCNLTNSLKLFLLGEIFTLLRDGGSFTDVIEHYHYCIKGSSRKEIITQIGFTRWLMIALFDINRVIGIVYRSTYNYARHLRNVLYSYKTR